MTFWETIIRAVLRTRLYAATVAFTYALSIGVGILMVHTGNTFALDYRDQLVRQAVQTNPAAVAAGANDPMRAALYDFAGNLVLGSLPKTISGFAIIFPYPLVAHQGWVGGIVSVRGDHTSRLTDPRSVTYYFVTLLLQLIPYSLTIGSGVSAGVAMFRPAPYYQGEKWLGIFPKEAVRDVARIYVLATPLFLIASVWEFFSPWNI